MSARDDGGPRLTGIAFLGGGTGGHLFPGIAVAEKARERFPGCRVVFFRTDRGVEDLVFEGKDFETVALSIRPPGRSPAGWLRFLRDLRRSRRQVHALLRDGFQVAFGLGGYASVPGLLAARQARIPVVLLEQNRVPGKVNRLFAPLAQAVSSAYPLSLRFCRRLELTGNPVRREVVEAAAARGSRPPVPPSAGEPRTVLVAGGSQGARGVNAAIRDALGKLEDLKEKICWIHVTGDADKIHMTEAYRTHGWKAEVLAYSPQLPGLMARSDLFLGRAGGTTLAELAVLGLPAVLIPYPHHRDQQQLRNARYLEQRGGARIIPQDDLGPESLRRVFEELLFVPERLADMGRSLRGLARPDAADAVVDLAVDLSRKCRLDSVSSS